MIAASRSTFGVCAVVAAAICATMSVHGQDAASGSEPRSNRWTIPDAAASERNPFPVTEEFVSSGGTLFASHCARCHGATGRNDGPDSDAAFVNADLTDVARRDINPDGVVFYKIWNGKGGMIPHERMPGFGFNGRLSAHEVWAMVAFVQTLRVREP